MTWSMIGSPLLPTSSSTVPLQKKKKKIQPGYQPAKPNSQCSFSPFELEDIGGVVDYSDRDMKQLITGVGCDHLFNPSRAFDGIFLATFSIILSLLYMTQKAEFGLFVLPRCKRL